MAHLPTTPEVYAMPVASRLPASFAVFLGLAGANSRRAFEGLSDGCKGCHKDYPEEE
jgi:hypothetical protein